MAYVSFVWKDTDCWSVWNQCSFMWKDWRIRTCKLDIRKTNNVVDKTTTVVQLANGHTQLVKYGILSICEPQPQFYSSRFVNANIVAIYKISKIGLGKKHAIMFMVFCYMWLVTNYSLVLTSYLPYNHNKTMHMKQASGRVCSCVKMYIDS